MAKQSTIFNFFSKSPPLTTKTKPSPSPTEADLPSSVKKLNTSPKEAAKEEASQNTKKTQAKTNKPVAKASFVKLFEGKTPSVKDR